MEATVTASDFRNKFPEIVKQVKNGESLVAILRSRPVFRIIPLTSENSSQVNWLSKLQKTTDYNEPSMEEINSLVHKLRKKSKK